MDLVERCSGWLSDYEVLEHLKNQQAERDRVSTLIGRPVKTAGNILTVEFETKDFLEKLGNRETNAKLIEELLLYLKGFPLTKAEKLQIVNILPRSEVEFYLIVEECEERFSPEQIAQVLDKIDSLCETVGNPLDAPQ